MSIGSNHPGESSNDSAGETLDVEGFGGIGDGGLSSAGGLLRGGLTAGNNLGGLGVGVQQQQQPRVGTVGGVTSLGASPISSRGGSRGIGIGIGVAAGMTNIAGSAHRGMKRELSDPNIAGEAGGDYGTGAGWAGICADMGGRSMSEQQKMERRVSRWCRCCPCCFCCCESIIIGRPMRREKRHVPVCCLCHGRYCS